MLQQGEILTLQHHFQYHIQHVVPVEVYQGGTHINIGLLTAADDNFAELQGILYNRNLFIFISRPGY